MFWVYTTKVINAVEKNTSTVDPCMFLGDRVIAVAFVYGILGWYVTVSPPGRKSRGSTDHGNCRGYAVTYEMGPKR